MYLTKNDQSIKAVLGGAPSTVNPTFVANYHNNNSGSGAGASTVGTLSATTIAVVPSPNASESLCVDRINIYNADSASVTVTVNFVSAGTNYALGVWTLSVGDTLQYSLLYGWEVINNSGSFKSTGTANGLITASTANSLTVGPNGVTNPTFNVDASTSSAATGLQVKGAAAAGGLAVSVLSSGAAENLTIDAKGSGTITLAGTSTGGVTIGQNLTISAKNIVTDGTTGTDIGTATTQKLGFWGVTPVVQPVANTDTTTGAAGSTTSVFLNTTFTGPSGSSAYTIGGIVKALKAVGILAA